MPRPREEILNDIATNDAQRRARNAVFLQTDAALQRELVELDAPPPPIPDLFDEEEAPDTDRSGGSLVVPAELDAPETIGFHARGRRPPEPEPEPEPAAPEIAAEHENQPSDPATSEALGSE